MGAPTKQGGQSFGAVFSSRFVLYLGETVRVQQQAVPGLERRRVVVSCSRKTPGSSMDPSQRSISFRRIICLAERFGVTGGNRGTQGVIRSTIRVHRRKAAAIFRQRTQPRDGPLTPERDR